MAGQITHYWDGTKLVVTSDSGTSSCDLQGPRGDMGIRGPQGAAGVCVHPDTTDGDVTGPTDLTEVYEKLDTIPLVVDEVLVLPVAHEQIVVGYSNSIDLASLNKFPASGERFWGVCKTTDDYVYSFVAQHNGEIVSAGEVDYAVFSFVEVVLLHDGSLDKKLEQDFATKEWVEGQLAQDSATQTWVEAQNYATQAWVTSQSYATQTWVTSQAQNAATQTWVQAQDYATKQWVAEELQGEYATKDWVEQQFPPGEDVLF